DAKNVLIRQLSWRLQPGQAAKQVTQRAGAGLRRMIGSKQLEDTFTDGVILLIDNGVAPAFNQHFGINHSREWHYVSVELESVSHGQAVRMAGHWNHVFRFEY